jgi:3-oxoadipate enol-lactonase
MPLVSHDGVQLNWRSDGASEAPALLLVNSLSSDLSMWDAVVPALLPHFRVIRFDNRGHGQSVLEPSVRGSDFSIEQLARDALAVADAAGAAHFDFIGISIGGMVGQWLGRHAAERVRRLVLSNTAAVMPAGVWAQRIDTVRAQGLATQLDSTMERWFTPAWRADPANAKTLAHTREVFMAVDVDGYLGCAAAVRDMDLQDALPGIAAPTLVVIGESDPSTPPALGAAMAERIPGARLVELPVAHMPPVEVPKDFARVVVDFLLASESA